MKTELLIFCFVEEKGLLEQDSAQDSFGSILVEMVKELNTWARILVRLL